MNETPMSHNIVVRHSISGHLHATYRAFALFLKVAYNSLLSVCLSVCRAHGLCQKIVTLFVKKMCYLQSLHFPSFVTQVLTAQIVNTAGNM